MTQLYAERIDALKSQSVPPIQPDDHIAEAIRKLLHTAFITLLEREAACREDRSSEAMREMRATAWQLWTFTEMIAPDVPGKTAKRTRKRLRKLIRRLDGVRELDIMMRDLLVHGEGSSDRMVIAGIIAHLDAKRLVRRNKLIKHLDSKKYRKFIKKYEKFLNSSFEDWLGEDDEMPHQVRHTLPAMLHEQLAAVRAHETLLADADADMLQDLYDDVRRLLCLLEGFEPVLGKSVGDYIDAVVTLRDKLEQVADTSRTLDRLIHLPRTTLDTAQFAALKRYRRRLQAQRDQLVNEFPDHWAAFNRRAVQKDFSNGVLVLLS